VRALKGANLPAVRLEQRVDARKIAPFLSRDVVDVKLAGRPDDPDQEQGADWRLTLLKLDE